MTVKTWFLAASLAVGGCGSSAKTERKNVQTTQVLDVNTKIAPGSAGVHPDWQGVPLDPAVAKGLAWLVSVQGQDGGWGQDGGEQRDVRSGVAIESSGNDVANTSIAALALLRAGITPTSGPYADNLNRALEFVLREVEGAPREGLAVTSRQGTQIQRKLGPNIDTFLSAFLLSEVDGRMPDAASQARVRAALEKVVAKIEKNQGNDGSWNAGGGWAPVIGTSIASRSLYNAQTKGVAVDSTTLKKVDDYTASNYDARSGSFSAGAGGAGVELYQASQALEQSTRTEASRKAAAPMNAAATAKLAEANFVSGFGSMGGEEFVSYLQISDSLVRTGGDPFATWNGKIKDHLVKLQNADGTWAGHHCITGRVACTSAAIMTLLTERTIARNG
jgi:hypothetical protein